MSPVQHVRTLAGWTAPISVAAGLADRDGALILLSDGGGNGRYSYVAAEPDRILVQSLGATRLADILTAPDWDRHVIGLLSYDWGARPATGPRTEIWPDLMLARYPALLRFDHAETSISALGLGATAAEAADRASVAEAWVTEAVTPTRPAPPALTFIPEAESDTYRAAVEDVVDRIAAGDLFQANIARAWSGRLEAEADPFHVFLRLADGAAPYGAFWRLGDRVLVSNSPELFLILDPADRRLETRPIKGTRPRGRDPESDAASAAELTASVKDRAENLMIVDLMRNDLARVAEPGSVRVERLLALESFATVHHLVSTIVGRARSGVGAAEVLDATFPPGSITGAPKHQAMKVIAAHEPPRGPWCGSLFLLDDQGRLTASVLIRTAAFERDDRGWRFRTLAGAGIVADSRPEDELAETETKITAIRRALTG